MSRAMVLCMTHYLRNTNTNAGVSNGPVLIDIVCMTHLLSYNLGVNNGRVLTGLY